MSRLIRVCFLISVMFLIVACNFPAPTPTEDPNIVFTAAAQTVEAQLTQPAQFSTPTLPPAAATNTSISSFPTLSLPTSTSAAPAQPVCDQAHFIKDVTIQDGTVFSPNATFTKTWRLRNTGTCTWTGYQMVFESGDPMSGTSPITIPAVAPGDDVDLSVNLTAPASVGSYRGYWRIRNGSGVYLPIFDGTDNRSFFVDIKVAVTSSGFDLYTRATEATWANGVGALTFGGPDTNTSGFAMFRNSQTLEDNSNPVKILETFPQMVNDGEITGLYPAYNVVTGEHFKAKIGFLSSCTGGNVKFLLQYKEGGVLKPLNEWVETCDNVLRDVDVDLTSLAGKSVQFALIVRANGTSDQDKAVWVSPQVSLP